MWSDVELLLTDICFLEAKNEAGLVCELAGDFAAAVSALPENRPQWRILGLLEEALLRDIHFIARHWTTLFQCLWNSCWWYDCPEAANHYNRPEGGWPPGDPPWTQPGMKLHKLLEAWRNAKEGGTMDGRANPRIGGSHVRLVDLELRVWVYSRPPRGDNPTIMARDYDFPRVHELEVLCIPIAFDEVNDEL